MKSESEEDKAHSYFKWCLFFGQKKTKKLEKERLKCHFYFLTFVTFIGF